MRALTRNPSSPQAQELARLGAEVVKADGFNHDEMRNALDGVWGFWLNTHHHDPVRCSLTMGFRLGKSSLNFLSTV